MPALTGAQYPLTAGDYQAVITERGAGLRELRYRGEPVIDGHEADEQPPGAAGQLLLPWPNRVAGGRYTFGGASYQLDLSEPAAGNAIHGLTRWSPWSPEHQAPDGVSLRLALLGHAGYPFALELTASYQLRAADGLSVTLTARNTGTRPAPYGAGAHPYLRVPAPAGECVLTLPAVSALLPDVAGIPGWPPENVTGTPLDFRAGRLIGAAQLDHAFTGLERDGGGRAWASLAGGGTTVRLWAGAGFGWLQAYTGDTLTGPRRRRAVAVEPMTCPANAFATGTDVITLAPGGTVTHSWGIGASAG